MKKNSLFAVVTVVIMSSFLFYAYEEGITGKTLKSSEPGCICHAETQSSEVNVIIDGPDELAVGQTAAYLIRISGGLLVRGGTNIAVSLGSLQAGDGMQKVSGELTHTFPKLPQDNEVVFEFNYTAPLQPTTITMYANGNSVNFSGTEIGDAWNYAENKSITIKSVAGQNDNNDNIEESNFYLAQNYPNPFNPTTSIQYAIDSRQFVSLKVYDITGQELITLINEEKEAGVHKAEFNSGLLSKVNTSGIYFYTLKTENFTSTKKMILLK